MNGKFIISLDFELHWGGVEIWDVEEKNDYFLNTVKLIPELLEMFSENSIRATWATVGFLFAKDKKQLFDFFPETFPIYKIDKLSAYNIIEEIGNNEKVDPFHFASGLIGQIIDTSGQELGSHTFSHYYCNEPGQNIEEFEADLRAAQAISKDLYGVSLKSLVFPRNQFNSTYLDVAKKNGIEVVRTNPDVWFWNQSIGVFAPLFRAIDTLVAISKPVCFKTPEKINGMIHLPASRFFRPYKLTEKKFQKLILNRIKREMTFAAKENRNYHLWWHPHNFGNHPENNKTQLLEIIKHFEILKNKYNFTSVNMLDFVND